MRAAASGLARLAVAGGCLALAGCGWGAGADSLEVVLIGGGDALAATDRASGLTGTLVRSATTEGLVGFDAQGRVVPALADRWIVFDNGESYIFRLRDGTWKDGQPLTAASAEAALREAIARTRGTALGLDLAVIETTRTMAARVIEIRLRQPMPDLLRLLALPELGLRHRGEGAGPMALARAGGDITLTPIDPRTLGLPEMADWSDRARALKVTALAARLAVARFSQGEADLVLGGRVESFPLTSTLGISRGTIQLDPAAGLFGLAVLDADGVLASAAARQAIAMAIDRDALVRAFNIGNWAATTRIVPAGTEDDPGADGERWAGVPLDVRRRQARAALAQALAGRPARPLRLALPAGPGSDLMFARLRQDFASVGLVATRAADPAHADLALLDIVARYPRAAWFLNALNCRVRRGLCDPGADAVMDEVRRASDAPTAARLTGEALASLTAANVFIPLAAPLRWSLVRGDVTGFATNPGGMHPLMPMAMRP